MVLNQLKHIRQIGSSGRSRLKLFFFKPPSTETANQDGKLNILKVDYFAYKFAWWTFVAENHDFDLLKMLGNKFQTYSPKW